MNKVFNNVLKRISNYDIDIKNNYKVFRFLQKLIRPSFFYKEDYDDMNVIIDDRKIRIRVFNPFANKNKNKVIIFVHGGGWVLGSVESYTKTCIELAKITKRIVIAIDYRLAPEHPYPQGFNDCYDVVNLIMNNLLELGLKNKDICLMGDSAGGNLVAAISLKARKTRDFKINKQILVYPALQTDYSDTTKYKSVIDKGRGYLLTQKQLQDYMALYVSNTDNLKNPYVCPMNAKFPFFQPKTLLVTAEFDPLNDEGRSYAKKLRLFFNDVKYYNIEGAMHGFLNNVIGKKHKEELYAKIVEFLGDANE